MLRHTKDWQRNKSADINQTKHSPLPPTKKNTLFKVGERERKRSDALGCGICRRRPRQMCRIYSLQFAGRFAALRLGAAQGGGVMLAIGRTWEMEKRAEDKTVTP